MHFFGDRFRVLSLDHFEDEDVETRLLVCARLETALFGTGRLQQGWLEYVRFLVARLGFVRFGHAWFGFDWP